MDSPEMFVIVDFVVITIDVMINIEDVKHVPDTHNVSTHLLTFTFFSYLNGLRQIIWNILEQEFCILKRLRC